MELTPLERMEATIRLEEPDRVPVWPQIYAYAPRVCKMSFYEYCTNANNLVKAQLAALKEFNYDAVGAYPDITVEAEAIGCEVHMPTNDIPEVKEPLIKSEGDLDKIRFPDPLMDGRMPLVVESIKMLRDKIGREVMIFSGFQGPFSLACQLRGLKELFIDLYVRPKFVKSLVEILTEILTQYGEAQVEAGAHVIEIGDSSSSLISPKQFEEFSYPFLRRIIEKIKRYGAFVALHICGNINPILNRVADMDIDILELDSLVSLEGAKEKVGRRVCLLGNIDPVKVMLHGTVEKVAEKAEECILEAAAGGGYILSTGCEPPLSTPLVNIKVLTDVAIKKGVYPIKW